MNDAPSGPPEELISSGLALLVLHGDGVAHLRLNRPEASNGLSMDMLQTLHATLLRVHGDGRIRALLLTGEGRHFCAGGDVHVFRAQDKALPDYIRVATALLQGVAGMLMRLQVPVVAAVQGYAAGGGGLGLVCCSDLVIAGESAKFLAGATRVGMAAGCRRVGDALAHRRVPQGDGDPADQPGLSRPRRRWLGLVNRVVPDAELEAAALALAQRAVARGPEGAGGDQAAALGWDLARRRALLARREPQRLALSGTADAREGLMAVIEKRAPVFHGR